tara:strand:- start:6 stop:185 length:180 start_codon:yes stop_codon:yes gene_type:complete
MKSKYVLRRIIKWLELNVNDKCNMTHKNLIEDNEDLLLAIHEWKKEQDTKEVKNDNNRR